ncbi:hypothetical protein MASR2M15_05560 [Anaerolineales bacterium]
MLIAGIILVISTIAMSLNTALTETKIYYTNILNERSNQIETKLINYRDEAKRISTQSQVIYWTQFNNPQGYIYTSDQIISTLGRRIDEFQSIRILDKSGNIRMQVKNKEGIPSLTLPQDIPETGVDYKADGVFYNMVNGTITSTTVAYFRKDRESDQIVFEIFEPIFSQETPPKLLGAIELVIDAEQIISIIENPEVNASLYPGLHIMMINPITETKQILADSGALNTLFRDNLHLKGGNFGGNALYNNISNIINKNKAGSKTAQLQDGIISTHTPIAEDIMPGWQLAVVEPLQVTFTRIGSDILINVSIRLLVLVALTIIIRLIIRNGLSPITQITKRVDELAAGGSSSSSSNSSRSNGANKDNAFNNDPFLVSVSSIAHQIEDLNRQLESQVKTNERNMEIAGRIGRETVTLNSLNELMYQTIETVCRELGYYHAQIFLVDDARLNAVLVYSRGETGQQMINAGHKLGVGSATVIGRVTDQGKPVIVNNIEIAAEGTHRPNLYLTETRAEMALPLIIGNEVIGALDIQSTETNAFKQQDIPTFQLIADQLAIAIYNTRLQEQSEARIQQIDRLNRQLTKQAWEQTQDRLNPEHRYAYDLVKIRTGDDINVAPGAVSTPIIVRGAVVGEIDVALPEGSEFSAEDRLILDAVAERVALALENARLFEQTEMALNQISNLYTATAETSRSRTLQELQIALKSALNALNPSYVGGYIIQLDGSEIVPLLDIRMNELEEAGLNIYDFLNAPVPDEGLFVERKERDKSHLGRLLKDIPQVQSYIMINLDIANVDSAKIFIGFERRRPMTDDDIRLMNALSASAAVVLDNQSLFTQIQNTLEETSVLYRASRELSESGTEIAVMEVFVKYVRSAAISHVMLLTVHNHQLSNATVRIAHSWRSDEDMLLDGIVLTRDEFPAWSLLESTTVRTISDIEDETLDLTDEERISISSLGSRAVALIPLTYGSRVNGIIWMGSEEPTEFSDRDRRIYQALAEQASVALEATRLFVQTERRAQQLELSAIVGQTIGQILDLQELLNQVVDLIKDYFGYDHVQIFLNHSNNLYTNLRASTGEAGQRLLAKKHQIEIGSQSVIGQTIQTGQVSLAIDTMDSTFIHKPNEELPLTRSEMGIPIVIKDRVVGALDVQSNEPNAFGEEDIRALNLLATQVAIAIENANLYQQTETRASEMAFLFDITTSAAIAETSQDALQTLVSRIREEFRTIMVGIFQPAQFIDANNMEFAALTPIFIEGDEMDKGQVTPIRMDDNDNLIALTALSRQAQVIRDTDKEIRYQPIHPNAKSSLVVPIIAGQDIVGTLVLEDQEVGTYTLDTLTLIQTMASSVSAIIQNAVLVEQLQSSNEQLREIDRLKSQFLANMSHELRTPLNSIIGYSRLMLKGIDGPITEMQEQDLSTIFSSGHHLLNLINDLLDQAKIESGKLDIKTDYFDMKELLETVKSLGIGLVKDKNLNLLVEVAPNLPKAFGDDMRTKQIIINLMSNAIKFTTEGSVIIRTYLVDREGDPFIQVDVQDTGIGIFEKDIPLLFETFRQVDSSLTRVAGGTGLGLPISKSLTEMQGGEMMVTSEYGSGSIFSITIPTGPGFAQEPQELEAEPSELRRSDTKEIQKSEIQKAMSKNGIPSKLGAPGIPVLTTKREALLIEDNKTAVDQMRKVLQKEGFQVQTADHPAYAEAMASNLRPTIIIMDVNFSNGEGWKILESLLNRDETADIPIIVSTESDEQERIEKLGAFAYLKRPAEAEHILETTLKAEEAARMERILIIDDDMNSVKLLEDTLKNSDIPYRIFVATTGKEGISKVARYQPNLILLDIRMPEIDGFTILNELRNHPETSSIPVIIVTAATEWTKDELEQLADIQVINKVDINSDDVDFLLGKIQSHLSYVR